MLAPDDDIRIVRLIASGVVAAHALVEGGRPLKLPYPHALQRGLDRVSLRCLLAGVRPPAGVPELLRWCHEPLGSWPLPLGGSDVTGDVLMDLGVPTRASQEWAIDSLDVEGELLENEVIAEVKRACRGAGRPDSYVAFRELATTRPVLTELELQKELMEDPRLELLQNLLKRCYPFAPYECERDGAVSCCADCHNLLVDSPTGFTCLDDRCPRKGPPRVGRVIPTSEEVRWLAGPLRAFVASPGRAEMRLKKQLDAKHPDLDVEMWPNFDAYDLRIVFPDDTAWAVDVKDWSNPVRLARRIKGIPQEPRWSRGFIVPSKDAIAARPGYLKTLRTRCRARLRGTGVAIASERMLISEVSKKLEEIDA